jgi:hypothetical protein
MAAARCAGYIPAVTVINDSVSTEATSDTEEMMG